MSSIRQLALIAAVMCAACGLAAAPYESSDKSPIGIGFAMMRPSDVRLRKIKSVWLGPMLDINIKHDELDRPVQVASIGWFGESSTEGRASFVALKASYIKRFGQSGKTTWYAGGGLDIYRATYRAMEYNPFTRQMQYVDRKGWPAGVNLVAGVEFREAWYAELRYDLLKSLSLETGTSVDFSSLSVIVGSRIAF